jgi:hypothetical protein
VTISYSGETLPEEALLLAGWLAGSLRWQPLDSPAFGVMTFEAGGRPLTLRFLPIGDGEGQLSAVEIVTEDGATYRVYEGDTPGLASCVAEVGGQASLERLVPFIRRDPVDLVVHALGRQGRDPVYEAALAAAAETAVLGVTA